MAMAATARCRGVVTPTGVPLPFSGGAVATAAVATPPVAPLAPPPLADHLVVTIKGRGVGPAAAIPGLRWVRLDGRVLSIATVPSDAAAVAAVAAATADAAAMTAAAVAATAATEGFTTLAGVGSASPPCVPPPLRLALPGADVERGRLDAAGGGTVGIRTRRGVKVKLRFPGGGGERPWGVARAWQAALIQASRRLGVGAFSVVTEGITPPPAAVVVALKRVNTRSMRRVDRAALAVEVALLRRLRHPSIVALIDVVETDGEVVLVTEAAVGGTVQAALEAAATATTAAEQGKHSPGKARRKGRGGAGRPLPRDLTRDLLRDVLSALAHLHARGVVHRDVSAANVLLRSPPLPSAAAATASPPLHSGGPPPLSPPPLPPSEQEADTWAAAWRGPMAPAGAAVLADFGLAVLPPQSEAAPPPQPVVASGSSDLLLPPTPYPSRRHEPLPRAAAADNLTARVGTAPYVAPEVMRPGRERAYGAAADVWSAGVLAHECLTGRLPFHGENAVEVWAAARRGLPPDGPLCGGGGGRGEEGDRATPLSPAATSLLRGLLCTRPSTRLTAAAALAAHPYFNPSMTVEGDDEVVVVVGGRPRLAAVAVAIMAVRRLASLCAAGSAVAGVVASVTPAAPASALAPAATPTAATSAAIAAAVAAAMTTSTGAASSTATTTTTTTTTDAAGSTAITATVAATRDAIGKTLMTPQGPLVPVKPNWDGRESDSSCSFAAAAAAARAAVVADDITLPSRRLRVPAAAGTAAASTTTTGQTKALATVGNRDRSRVVAGSVVSLDGVLITPPVLPSCKRCRRVDVDAQGAPLAAMASPGKGRHGGRNASTGGSGSGGGVGSGGSDGKGDSGGSKGSDEDGGRKAKARGARRHLQQQLRSAPGLHVDLLSELLR
ncbi:hypothetical protein MMPV_002658 [Pyropia vietnamensis]